MRRVLPALFLLLLLAACDSNDPDADGGDLIVEDLDPGSGDAVAEGDAVMIAYVGSLEDGTVFDVSDDQNPLAFLVGAGQVIEGMDQGLVGMKPGGTRRLTIPPGLAYGSSGVCTDAACPVPGGATLVFEVTLIRILDQPFVRDDFVGDGTEVVEGAFVVFHYTAALSSGAVVGSSTLFNNPVNTVVGAGALVPGLEQGIVGMRQGGTRTIIVPPHLAYGDQGDGRLIPPNAVLRYTVNMLIVTADT